VTLHGIFSDFNKADSLASWSLAPYLAGFTSWARKQVKKTANPKLLFLSREGEILHKFWERVVPEVPSFHLPISRIALARIRAITNPSLFVEGEDDAFRGSLSKFLLARLGMNHNEIEQYLDRHLGSKFLSLPGNANRLSEGTESIRGLLIDQATVERNNLMRYLTSRIEPDFDVFVADLGYSGTIQLGLERLLGTNSTGLYGITSRLDASNPKTLLRRKAWLIENAEWGMCEELDNSGRLEVIFSSTQWESTSRFYLDETTGLPIRAALQDSPLNDWVSRLQSSAMETAELLFEEYSGRGAELNRISTTLARRFLSLNNPELVELQNEFRRMEVSWVGGNLD
jgi:hypothetical protein